MANRINYERVMEETIAALKRDGQRPQLLLHACCAPCSSATLERLADHFDVTILYYNPNIAPPEEYHRREAELERFVRDAGYAARGITVVELPYDPQEFYTAVKGLENEPERGERCTVCYRMRLELVHHHPFHLPGQGPCAAEHHRLRTGPTVRPELPAKRVPQKGRLQAQPCFERRIRPVPAGLLRLHFQQAGTRRLIARRNVSCQNMF